MFYWETHQTKWQPGHEDIDDIISLFFMVVCANLHGAFRYVLKTTFNSLCLFMIYCFYHSKIKFISLLHHVTSSIYCSLIQHSFNLTSLPQVSQSCKLSNKIVLNLVYCPFSILSTIMNKTWKVIYQKTFMPMNFCPFTH